MAISKPKKTSTSPTTTTTTATTTATPAANSKPGARVGVVQWQMRHFISLNDFLNYVEAYVRTLAGYKCDLVVFPEFFSAPLTGLTPALTPILSMRDLALLTPKIIAAISRMAVAHKVNILAGSLPHFENKAIHNVAYFCHRNGRVDSQYKLHPTPAEKRDWGIVGGNSLTAYDTDFGRIGMLVCYDVEFPELARLLAEQNIQLLLVPFWTDNKNGYLRIRLCAQARAIENECYVVIAGSTGSTPVMENVELQYAQSAIFSPSDIGFPHDAIINEATANVECTLVADLDFTKLQQLKQTGSVRNSNDRRRDLFGVQWLGKK